MIFSAVIVLCTVVWMCFFYLKHSNVAAVYSNGKLIERIDLTTVTGQREIEVKNGEGVNIIIVKNNYIAVKSATCPDKICINHGQLKSSASPIVCLPNKLVIKFEDGSAEVDGKTGVAK